NVAMDVLTAIGHAPGKGDGSHKKVVIYFRQSGDVVLETVGTEIDRVRTMRNLGDYDMKDPDVEDISTSRKMVETAQQAIEHLDVFAKDVVRKKAAAEAIAQYKIKIRIE